MTTLLKPEGSKQAKSKNAMSKSNTVRTYLDLETIEKHNGFIKDLRNLCNEQLVYIDVTDTDILFHLDVNDGWLYFVVGKNYRRIKFGEEMRTIQSPEDAIEFIAETIEKLRK